ncbi:MAG: hypothetical protein AMQ74_01917 [Candidatus Methanofastidiosum methylothiophilum]|uniref:Uncharacterized protein n=1 Tax=Candidatus Methanofastidiosum methylothiophilum TaxID=1705564 RepID=A0A150IJ61_9EURY|nr:MAG: hypothetical protein AMQ74_01917 [Candidatus Methanofastidiosum methylthiophilus]
MRDSYRTKMIMVWLLTAVAIFSIFMVYGVGYSVYYTPTEIRNEGYVLVLKDTLIGKMYNYNAPIDTSSVMGNIYDYSEDMFNSLPGVDDVQAKIFARLVSIFGIPVDATIWLTRWFGDKYNGLNYYMDNEVFGAIIKDFNDFIMPVPYHKFFVQLALLGGVFGLIGGYIVTNMAQDKKKLLEDIHDKRLAYKPRLGEYVRVTDYVSVFLSGIISIASTIAMINHFTRWTLMATTVIHIILLANLKINSPFKIVDVRQKGKKPVIQTFEWRDGFARWRHIGLAIGGISFLYWVLYYEEAITNELLFSWMGALMYIMGAYLVFALAIRYVERLKVPGGRKHFSLKDYIPRPKIFRTLDDVAAKNIQRESKYAYDERTLKNLKKIKAKEEKTLEIKSKLAGSSIKKERNVISNSTRGRSIPKAPDNIRYVPPSEESYEKPTTKEDTMYIINQGKAMVMNWRKKGKRGRK